MNKSDILETLINFYTDGNKARFASKIGVKPQTINTWIIRNTFDIDVIYSKCEGVSGDFLLTGKGSMLIKDRFEYSDEVEQLKKEIAVLKAMQGKNDKTLEIAMKLYQTLGEAFTAYYEQMKGE